MATLSTPRTCPEVAEYLREVRRKEESYIRYLKRYKAKYTLDIQDENALRYALVFCATPDEMYERKLEIEQLHIALNALPDKQRQRIYAHYILGMTKCQIARVEGVDESTVRESIEGGLLRLKKFF